MNLEYKEANRVDIDDVVFHIEVHHSTETKDLAEINVDIRPLILPFRVFKIEKVENGLIKLTGQLLTMHDGVWGRPFGITIPEEKHMLLVMENDLAE